MDVLKSISSSHILSFVWSPGSLCGCNLCKQLLLLVPWCRPLRGHPHPAQHSVWELVWKVPETHHPERIWSRCGARASQCEDPHTHIHVQLPDYLYIFIKKHLQHPKAMIRDSDCNTFPQRHVDTGGKKLSFHSPGSTLDVYWGVPEGSPAELPRHLRPEEEAVRHWWTHLELCRLHDCTRYCICRSQQPVKVQVFAPVYKYSSRFQFI